MDNHQSLRENLKKIGFTEPEITIYLELLPRGALSIAEIEEITHLPRSTVAFVINRLLEHGVIKFFVKGKRKNYYAESAESVMKFIMKEEEQLRLKKVMSQTLIPQLEALHYLKQQDKANVRFFEGEEGFKEIYGMTLEQPRGGEILRFGVSTEKFNVLSLFLKEYTKLKLQKKIKTRLLIPESPLASAVKTDDPNDLRETRTLSRDIYNPKVNIAIWGNKVTYTIWDKSLTTILIESAAFTDTMKMIFELCWEMAKRQRSRP